MDSCAAQAIRETFTEEIASVLASRLLTRGTEDFAPHCSCNIRREMPEDLKMFEAVFTEWTGWECTIRRITFEIEDEDDALAVAEDIALLEGYELIYLLKY